MTHTDCKPTPALERERGKGAWDHEAPHHSNDGGIDGDGSFDDEVLEGFRDGDD